MTPRLVDLGKTGNTLFRTTAVSARRLGRTCFGTSVEIGVPACLAVPRQDGAQHSPSLPATVNWFVETTCNYACKFCFATFRDIPRNEVMKEERALLELPRQLQRAGALKLTFVGGEPLLHPMIVQLIEAAKSAGLTTCIVTNGSFLDASLLRRLQGHLDWLTFSIDASADTLHDALGRGSQTELRQGSSQHLARCERLWDIAKPLGYRLKLNTVVCRPNINDDMNELVLRLVPDRWKVFKVLPIAGQNDGVSHADVSRLLISNDEFEGWIARHRRVQDAGIPLVAETNEQMTGTYAMLDARGRFFSNTTGRHLYGPSVFDVGVNAAWSAVDASFNVEGFAERGGVYEWSAGASERAQEWVQSRLGEYDSSLL